MDYIFDGEVHSLNDKYFYIIEKYRSCEHFNEKDTKRKFLDKYIWYLFSVDFSHSQIEDIINEKERFVFINEKPFDTASVRKCGTYCMKFKKENR
jgi:hypothetical protein